MQDKTRAYQKPDSSPPAQKDDQFAVYLNATMLMLLSLGWPVQDGSVRHCSKQLLDAIQAVNSKRAMQQI